MCIMLLFSDVKLLSLKTLCGDCSMCFTVHLEENSKVLDVVRAVMYRSGPCGRDICGNCNWRWICQISELNFQWVFQLL